MLNRVLGLCIFWIAVMMTYNTSNGQSCNDHGVPVNGVPNWHERTMFAMTNAVRVSPTDFRDYYLGVNNILLPQNYPAQPPLRFAPGLINSSRAHSLDMATNFCFQHNSCDGTTWAVRIGGYYPNWALLGENVAGGFTHPVSAVLGLLSDPIVGVGPAPDLSGFDGHRWNIMYVNYTDVGAGFAENSDPQATYHRYYTQDFGRPLGDISPLCSPISSGTHFVFDVLENGIPVPYVHYFVTFYDANNNAPLSVNVIFNEVTPIPMPHRMGSLARGSYEYITLATSICHVYHFEIIDSNSVKMEISCERKFLTTTEGTCTTDYIACITDYNGNNVLETQDIFDFMNGWLASAPGTDFNRDGILSTQDLFDFMNAWFVGC